ncbi:hypothetical protein [Natrinema longum]|uniref:Uncharacterized protein n=1 Tax=Natrinema longum TaxID=370324 RepID=A0A8A2UCC3_9EURY|nr:hypothetical protein [Natrinema longum]QSW86356.1 hypothetical protein J0X27_05925 [Natrinema longum]
MSRTIPTTGRWGLEPNANEAPLSVGILGWIVLIDGLRIGIHGISGETTLGMWPAIVFGGCTVAIGWTIITGRPIGLAGGFLAWSFHITVGFFRVLNSGTVEDDVDLLLGIMTATTLWLVGLWFLYRHRAFFLEHAAPDCDD